MAGELIPLSFRPNVQMIPLGQQYQDAETLRGTRFQNDQAERGQNALEQYNQAKQAGDPNAMDHLNTLPAVQAQIVQTRNQMAEGDRQRFDFIVGRRARAANSVAVHPAGSKERQEAWNNELLEMRKDGAIDEGRFTQLYGKPPNELILQQYIAAGMAVPEYMKIEQAKAGIKAAAQFGAAVQGATSGAPATAPAVAPRPGAPTAAAPAVGPAAAPAAPAAPAANGRQSSMDPALMRSESGGNDQASNQLGYSGGAQFGAPRLTDLGVYSPGAGENLRAWSKTAANAPGKWSGEFNIPGFPQVKTIEDFKNNPAAQRAVEDLHQLRMGSEIKQNGFDQYIGQTVGGVRVTEQGLRNGLHLGGVGGVQRFLQSNGADNPTDANGTSVGDYLKMGAAKAAGGARDRTQPAVANPDLPAPTLAGFGGNEAMQQLLGPAFAVLSNPAVPEGTRKAAEAVIDMVKKDREMTSDQKEYISYYQQTAAQGGTPLPFLQYQTSLKESGRTLVSAVAQGERKGTEALFTKTAEDFQGAQAAVREAAKRKPLYTAMRQAMTGFQTGGGSEQWLTAKALLRNHGIIPGADVPDGEVFKAMQRRLEIAATPKGQGAITENERHLIREQIPNLGASPEANLRILDMLERLDAYDLKVAKIYRDSARKNGGAADPVDVADAIAELEPPLTTRDYSFLDEAKEKATPGRVEAPSKALPVITTQEEYDKLAPGTEFTGSDGKPYSKPRLKGPAQ
jgi:hypothetical protein